MALRTCRICGKEAKTTSDLELFRKAKGYKYGRDNLCRECVAKTSLEHYHRNRDRINKERAKKRQENPEKMREMDRKYRENNPEKIRKKAAKYRLKHREQIAQRDRNLVLFKDKRILLKENPRTNICSECGRQYPEDLKHQTVMHHEHYDSDDPLEDTIELCKSCHGKLHNPRGKSFGLNLLAL